MPFFSSNPPFPIPSSSSSTLILISANLGISARLTLIIRRQKTGVQKLKRKKIIEKEDKTTRKIVQKIENELLRLFQVKRIEMMARFG